MVGELTPDVGNLNVVNVVVTEHLLGNLSARHTVREGHLRILRKDRLQASLHDVTHDTYDTHQDD